MSGVAGILSEDLHCRPDVEHDFRLGGVGKRAVDGRDREEVVVQRIELAGKCIKTRFTRCENLCLCVKLRNDDCCMHMQIVQLPVFAKHSCLGDKSRSLQARRAARTACVVVERSGKDRLVGKSVRLVAGGDLELGPARIGVPHAGRPGGVLSDRDGIVRLPEEGGMDSGHVVSFANLFNVQTTRSSLRLK